MDPEFYTYDAEGNVIRNPAYITEWVYHSRGVVLGAAGVLCELRTDVNNEIEDILGESDVTPFPEDS